MASGEQRAAAVAVNVPNPYGPFAERLSRSCEPPPGGFLHAAVSAPRADDVRRLPDLPCEPRMAELHDQRLPPCRLRFRNSRRHRLTSALRVAGPPLPRANVAEERDDRRPATAFDRFDPTRSQPCALQRSEERVARRSRIRAAEIVV